MASGGPRARRILHFIPTLGPGGAERQLAYLCSGLAELGWEVHVGCFRGGPNLARVERSGAELHRLPRAGAYDPRLPWSMRRLVRRLRPAVVQTWLPAMDILGGLVALGAGVPWVLSERSSPDGFARMPRIRLLGLLAPRAAAVVANSREGAAYWSRRLPGRIPCRIVPNALPLREIDAAVPAPAGGFGLRPDRPLVLFVGRLDRGKNVEQVLPALARVVREGPAVALVCGEGPLRPFVDAFLREHALRGAVAAPGFVTDAWGWMKRASVLVSVSRVEGMPNAVMEAMAAGCPLVVSEIDAHRDIVGAEEARFVAVDTSDAIAAGILSVLRDPDASARRAARARARARAWSIDAVSRRYDEIYREVSRDPAGPVPLRTGAPLLRARTPVSE